MSCVDPWAAKLLLANHLNSLCTISSKLWQCDNVRKIIKEVENKWVYLILVAGPGKKSGKEAKIYQCDKCKYSTAYRSYLGWHRATKHGYKCYLCKYSFTKAQDLKRHRDGRHMGVRYPCDQYEYSATKLSNLKVHKESRYDSVRYPCELWAVCVCCYYIELSQTS